MVLAIIAGKGDLPKMIVKQCQEEGQEFLLILIKGEDSNREFLQFPHYIFDIGYIGKIIDKLKEKKIDQLVFAGGITKPSMSGIKVDAKGAILLSRILGARLFGDDNLLSTIISFFEQEGFKVVGADTIIKDLIVKKGVLSKVKPENAHYEDIEIGRNALKIISDLDIGQSVVVQQKQIIGVEAIEGTDSLITRCAELKFKNGKKPVLIKMKKVNQNTKVDLPSLGITTIKNLHESGFSGIAIEAESSLIINQSEVIKLVDKYGLFIVGI